VAKTRVLVVEDDAAHADAVADALGALDVEVVLADTGEKGVERLRTQAFPVVITDLVMTGVDGFAVLTQALAADPTCRVILLTGHGNRDVAVRAMEEGATYYIEKPANLAELRTKVQKSIEGWARDREYADLRRQVDRQYRLEGIIGRDPAMQRIIDVVMQVAPTHAGVLILGESGTGKELIARAIHHQSPRRNKVFVALNCGGLSEGTIESELFGHVRGSFTGATEDREGKFEYADGGTLFLDEVGEMPQSTQVKLLRVLEDRQVVRVGANKSRKVDVRVIAATNADLANRVKEGRFREDLLYRLKVVTIEVPPLRARRADIKLLIDHFLAEFSRIHQRDISGIDRDALQFLVQHDWPGNVRELRNTIESMVVRSRGNILTRHDIPPEINPSARTDEDPWRFLAGKGVTEVEKNHIRVTLELVDGNRGRAAEAMGLSERTLYRKLKDYGLV
jgi:two-component system response regulator HydG